jgi:hypothetical protein
MKILVKYDQKELDKTSTIYNVVISKVKKCDSLHEAMSFYKIIKNDIRTVGIPVIENESV